MPRSLTSPNPPCHNRYTEGREWVNCPCERRRLSAESAAGGAQVAFNETEGESAHFAAAAFNAADAVAHAANDPALAVAGASFVALVASYADDFSDPPAAEDPDAEREWQRLRLVAYVLGEVEI